MKYLIEGAIVMITVYLSKGTNLQSTIILGLVASLTFLVLDKCATNVDHGLVGGGDLYPLCDKNNNLIPSVLYNNSRNHISDEHNKINNSKRAKALCTVKDSSGKENQRTVPKEVLCCERDEAGTGNTKNIIEFVGAYVNGNYLPLDFKNAIESGTGSLYNSVCPVKSSACRFKGYIS